MAIAIIYCYSYLSIRLQRGAVAHTLIDRDTNRESNTLQDDFASLTLVLVHSSSLLFNQFITEFADVHHFGTWNTLIKDIILTY